MKTDISIVRRCAGAVLAGVALFVALGAAPAPAVADPATNCEEMLEKIRLWIRATDPRAPDEEQRIVRAAIEETHTVCEAARTAAPGDGKVLVNVAYAKFSVGDKPAGVRLIEQAAEAGYPPAMVMMARFLSTGDTVEKDVEGAWEMLLRALNAGHPSARIKAAMEFMPGGAGPENPKRTTRVLREMIDEGNSEAMVAYAMEVLKLPTVEPGSAAAAEGVGLLERAASDGKDGSAMINLSLLYNQGRIVERSTDKAAEYARMAIDAGHRRGYGTMGQVFQNQNDPKAAVEWFRRGAEAGDGFSQGMLGFMYSGGFGVEQDIDKAVEWWTRGRWNGDDMSASYLQVHRERQSALDAEAEKTPSKDGNVLKSQ